MGALIDRQSTVGVSCGRMQAPHLRWRPLDGSKGDRTAVEQHTQ